QMMGGAAMPAMAVHEGVRHPPGGLGFDRGEHVLGGGGVLDDLLCLVAGQRVGVERGGETLHAVSDGPHLASVEHTFGIVPTPSAECKPFVRFLPAAAPAGELDVCGKSH